MDKVRPSSQGARVGPHLDVLYHDAVGEAMSLQISFDIIQFREGDSHVHREAGSGWATPEVHLVNKGEKARHVYYHPYPIL